MRPLLTRIIPAAVLAAIIAAGGAAVAGAGGGDSTAPADEVSSPAPIPTGSNGQEPTHLEALASHGDQVGVVDSNGDKVGFMDAADLLYSDLTIVREMRAYGIEDTRTLADDVASAFTTLAALPVTNERGELVGYFANRFIPLDRWDEARAEAEKLIATLRPPEP